MELYWSCLTEMKEYKKLFVVLTKIIEISYLRFLADTYKNIFHLTKLIPKTYIGTFIEIMKKKFIIILN